MSNPSQLFLLSDHIKLSLLERQRAESLNLDPNPTRDSHISRSLESLHDGLEKLEQKAASSPAEVEQLQQIRSQYNDLSRQFHGENLPSTAGTTVTSANDPALQPDIDRAAARRSSSFKRDSAAKISGSQSGSKNVRFRDNPSEEDGQDPNRAALFPNRYTDEPSSVAAPDPTQQMDNQQIHAYHEQVMAEQDEQLDTLSESIGRQRHISMAIGDELEGHVALLDEVDRGVDRHQGRLDGAQKRLKGVSQKARENWGMTTIIVLIVILVLLIVILK